MCVCVCMVVDWSWVCICMCMPIKEECLPLHIHRSTKGQSKEQGQSIAGRGGGIIGVDQRTVRRKGQSIAERRGGES